MTTRVYGWRADQPDHRDYHANFAAVRAEPLPPMVDRRAACPAIYDQGARGNCTAQAVGGSLHFTGLERRTTAQKPSPRFIYFFTRQIEGNAGRDSGATLRGTMKAVASYGYCGESLCGNPVVDYNKRPSREAIAAGAKAALRSSFYARVAQTGPDLKAAVATGNPVAFGCSISDSFESRQVTRSGVVPMPAAGEKIIGGHAMLIVGYDDAAQVFIVRNSWGADWGARGYCFMPYAFILNRGIAADFWTVSRVGDAAP